MKKVIAILLVLLVTGVVFGADKSLTITSNVDAKTNHGFHLEALETVNFGTIFSETFSDVTNSTVLDLYKEYDSGEAVVGYYSYATTAQTGASVTFEVSPFEATVDSATYYVPFDLDLTDITNNNITANLTTLTMSATAPSTTKINPEEFVIFSSASGAGQRYIDMAVNFVNTSARAAANLSLGLPALEEGNYTATIIAKVQAD